MQTTVLVVSWNSAPDLRSCLRSVPAGTSKIVIDNASSDDSVAVAKAAGAHVIISEVNVGFAAAVNLGLSHVVTEAVALVNPDVIIGSGALERCAVELEREPTVGLVGPNTRLPDGRPEPPAARHDRTALHIAVESVGLVRLSRRLDLQMVHGRSHNMDVDAVNGAFMVMRTDLLQELGGLDDTVFMYFEDQDLCRRVRDAGYRVRFLADVHAVHGNGTSTSRGDRGQQVRAYLHRRDADLEFLRRYGRPGEVTVAWSALVLRSMIGLLVSIAMPERRARYRSTLWFLLRQVGGRRPPPPV